MKYFKYIKYSIIGVCLLAVSCNINELPKFSDKDAYVAFQSSSLSFDETAGTVEIEVQLVSIGGISGTVSYTVIDSTAIEGIDFNIVGNKTLTFSGEKTKDYIQIQIVDNDDYTGDLTFSLVLNDPGIVNLGGVSTCTIRIIDDEHPLSDILGTYSASADSYFADRGHYDWDITFDKDDDDDKKVWIGNLEPFFAANGYVAPKANYFYGVVNEDMTEIRVPVNQDLGYPDTKLVGFYTDDPNESGLMGDGENIIISILADGNLRVDNAFGSNDGGWWNIMYGNLILYKK